MGRMGEQACSGHGRKVTLAMLFRLRVGGIWMVTPNYNRQGIGLLFLATIRAIFAISVMCSGNIQPLYTSALSERYLQRITPGYLFTICRMRNILWAAQPGR